MDCIPPGSSVHGISQASILEWVAIFFSGIFPTQGLNLSLLHCRQSLYRLSHQILVSCLFSLQLGTLMSTMILKPVQPNLHTAAAAAKSLQSCPTLCDPIDGSPPGSPVPGIVQARTLEWVAISFSNAWKWKIKVKSLSRIRLLATPWTATCHYKEAKHWLSKFPLLSTHRTFHLQPLNLEKYIRKNVPLQVYRQIKGTKH